MRVTQRVSNIKYILVATVLALQTIVVASALIPGRANAAAPGITVGSNASGAAEQSIPITGISITGDSEDPVPITLRVPSGELSLGTTTGLTFTNNLKKGSTISFSGDISAINAALATLKYRNMNATTVTLDVSLLPPGVVYYPGNGHMYRVVNAAADEDCNEEEDECDSSGSITATDARTAAATHTLNGAQGYLATVTTQGENDYITGRLSGDGWIGASDEESEDDWKWVTGPEADTSFWSGLGADEGGQPVGGLFSNWAEGEPNNAGDEDCAQFYSNGTGWNDLPCSATLGSYVVEFGDDGQLPTAPVSDSIDITTTAPETEPENVAVSSCLDVLHMSEDPGAYRYDNIKLSQDIDCEGEIISALFADEIVGQGRLDFRGTFDGQGHTISNFNIDRNYTEGYDDSEDDEYMATGFFSSSMNATFQNLNLSGTISNEGYCTGGLVGEATNTNIYNVTTNIALAGSDGATGGLVGCYHATGGETSSIEGNSAQGDITGNYELGGIIGDLDVTESSDLTLSDNAFSGDFNDEGGYYYGGIIGYGEIYDGTSSLTVTNNTSAGLNTTGTYVGGILGQIYGNNESVITVTDNQITDDVTGNGVVGGLGGGLYGYDESEFTVSGDSDINVSALNSGSVGGLIGEAYGIHIEDSQATGDVHTVANHAGGLIGFAGDRTSIERTSATGNVVADSEAAGGLVGRLDKATIKESFATGNATVTYTHAGGLVGIAPYPESHIENSYARGTVTADDSAGGLTGSCGATIDKSYSTGVAVATNNVGGLVGAGEIWGAYTCATANSFWDTLSSELTGSQGGTGKNTSDMKNKATYTTVTGDSLTDPWNFDDTWGITSAQNNGYPCLRWSNNSCVNGATNQEDEDGIDNTVEAAAPNNGDANNDGIPDNQQANVASYVNPMTNSYAVLAAPSDCSITAVKTQAENNNAVRDSGFNYPVGMMNFTLNCGTPNYVAVVTIYQYGMKQDGLSLRKHNPNTGAYFTVTSPTITQQTIGGKRVTSASYQIADGGILDVDGTANGVIVDPIGFAQNTVGAPNTGLLRK